MSASLCDHAPDWQRRILLNMAESRSVYDVKNAHNAHKESLIPLGRTNNASGIYNGLEDDKVGLRGGVQFNKYTHAQAHTHRDTDTHNNRM